MPPTTNPRPTTDGYQRLLRAGKAVFKLFMAAALIALAPSLLAAIVLVEFVDVWREVDVELRTLVGVLQIAMGLGLVALGALLGEK